MPNAAVLIVALTAAALLVAAMLVQIAARDIRRAARELRTAAVPVPRRPSSRLDELLQIIHSGRRLTDHEYAEACALVLYVPSGQTPFPRAATAAALEDEARAGPVFGRVPPEPPTLGKAT